MDSPNILSILAALGQGAQPPVPITNVLQAAAPTPPPVGIAAAVAPEALAPAVVAQPLPSAPPVVPVAGPPIIPQPQAAPAQERPRKRLSVLDIIGRAADAFATAGGAPAQYQSSLDARVDHADKVDMNKLEKALNQQKITAGEFDIQADERKRLGTALGALTGRENAADLWPSIAEQAGIDPTRTAAIGQILQANPDAAGIFAKSLGADIDNLGKNVYFGTDPAGKTVAYQVGPDGQPHILDFGGKLSPSDPIKIVNTGGANVVVGSDGHTIKRILPNTPRPDTVVTTQAQRDIAAGHDRTNITIAGMPARSKGADGKGSGDNSAFIQTAQGNLEELRQIYGTLHEMGAMVSPAQAASKNVQARIRASGIGQTLEGAVGTQAQTQRDRVASIRPQLMQTIAKATGMTGKQLDSNADVKLFMQTVTDPGKSYEANIRAIDGLERFLKANAKKPTAAAPATVRPAAKPGWGKATVVSQ